MEIKILTKVTDPQGQLHSALIIPGSIKGIQDFITTGAYYPYPWDDEYLKFAVLATAWYCKWYYAPFNPQDVPPAFPKRLIYPIRGDWTFTWELILD